MVSQSELTEKLGQLLGSGAGGADGLQLRSDVGRLNFSAGRWADRNPCECQACQWLREANDLMMSEATPPKGTSVAGDDSKP